MTVLFACSWVVLLIFFYHFFDGSLFIPLFLLFTFHFFVIWFIWFINFVLLGFCFLSIPFVSFFYLSILLLWLTSLFLDCSVPLILVFSLVFSSLSVLFLIIIF